MFKNLNLKYIGIDFEIHKALKSADLYGFQGIDVDLPRIKEVTQKYSISHVENLFSRYPLKIGSWELPINWRKEDTPLKNEMGNLRDYARIADALGCRTVWTWIVPFSDSRKYEENFEYHLSRLQPVAEVLDEFSCSLALEFVGTKTFRDGHKYEFIHTLRDAKKLSDATGRNVGLVLDSWHWYVSNGTISDLKGLDKKDILVVHVNDAPVGVAKEEQIDTVRRLPGETGVIDVIGFLQAINTLNYDGSVTPEPFSKKLTEMNEEKALQITAGSMNKIWRELGFTVK